MVAEVLINENVNILNRTFDYNIPKSLQKEVKVGSRVRVIFNRRKIDGFVLNIKEYSDFPKLLNILEIIANDDLTKDRIELAKYMSVKYFASLSSCIKLMLNPGISKKDVLKKNIEKAYVINSAIKEIYLKYIGENLDNINFEQEDEKELFNEVKKILKDKLNINITINHFKVIQHYIENEIDIDYEENLCLETEVSKSILNIMVKNNVLKKEEIEVLQNIYKYNKEDRETKLELNDEQKIAFNKITDALSKDKYKEFLLFGVTGSGKTEVYMQVIEDTIARGKTAIMLVPEIGLTPQMEKVFSKRFGSNISIMHSRLTARERFDEWKNIQNGDKKIVIGTRSAVFAPLKNIGVIIIDEQHDFSYISGSNPRYDAKDIARYIAKQKNAVFVSGSATPLITSMYEAKTGKVELLTLKNRISSLKLPEVEVINMRTNKNMFSDELINYLIENIEKGKQSLMFLNRRGFSNLAICRACGETNSCPNCSVNLTYHKKGNVFKCHYCGYTEKNTWKCKNCNNEMSFIGFGTQKVQEELERKFTELYEKGEIKRNITSVVMDQDSVNISGGHKEIIDEFINKKRDVLIGTQMIAKGHHFPDVNLASVLLADNILNSENYDGAETAFQTLVQVMGRAGREENGKALIQTYNPEHYIIELAKKNDYESFYNMEIDMRRILNYPPFTDILTFQIFSNKNENAERIAGELEFKLKKYVDVLKNKLLKNYEKRLDINISKMEKNNEIKSNKISEDKIKKEKQEQKEKYRKKQIEIYKKYLDKIEIYDMQPYRINKVNNIYRWKIIMKVKYTSIVMQWIKDILNSVNLPKKTQINVLINGID